MRATSETGQSLCCSRTLRSEPLLLPQQPAKAGDRLAHPPVQRSPLGVGDSQFAAVHLDPCQRYAHPS